MNDDVTWCITCDLSRVFAYCVVLHVTLNCYGNTTENVIVFFSMNYWSNFCPFKDAMCCLLVGFFHLLLSKLDS